jgi:hypothetical protein
MGVSWRNSVHNGAVDGPHSLARYAYNHTEADFGARTRHSPHWLEAVVAGATDPDSEDVEVLRRLALTMSRVEMLEAVGYTSGAPTSLGNREV